MFIEKGIPATYTDTLTQTVLYYVAREGKLNCVDMLIKLGKSSENICNRLQCEP